MHRLASIVLALTALCGCGNGTSGGDLGGQGAHPSGTITTPTEHRPVAPPACDETLPGCRTDADCAAAQDCVCNVSVGLGETSDQCLPSNCRLDSDCASGYCSPSYHPGGPGGCGAAYDGWYCHTSADECGTDGDCVSVTQSAACMYAPELGHWTCVGYTICAG